MSNCFQNVHRARDVDRVGRYRVVGGATYRQRSGHTDHDLGAMPGYYGLKVIEIAYVTDDRVHPANVLRPLVGAYDLEQAGWGRGA